MRCASGRRSGSGTAAGFGERSGRLCGADALGRSEAKSVAGALQRPTPASWRRCGAPTQRRDVRHEAHPRGAPDQPAKFVTRVVLKSEIDQFDQDMFNRLRQATTGPGRSIEAVVAYGSWQAFRSEMDATTRGARPDARAAGRDGLLLSWDLLVPDDPDLTDHELLSKLVELRQDRTFAEHLSAFHDYRRRLADRLIDPEAARAEIGRRLDDYNSKLKDRSRLQIARTIVTYVAIAAPLVDLIAPAWAPPAVSRSVWLRNLGRTGRPFRATMTATDLSRSSTT